MMKCILLIAVLLAEGLSNPIKSRSAQTCQSCHPVDPDKINVHLIPHSHDDVGWLKTVDQYFYGSHSEIQSAGVQYIITSVVEALKDDDSRRYVQVETAFFWKWWKDQTEATRQDFIDLVNNGQIEIINAAWSMNDEAAVNYQSTIDQFTYGLGVINETLGECAIPRIGWQIDPFGHSREQASIFAQLGYDGVFFARIDYRDRATRDSLRDMEVIWQGSANLGSSNIFTNIFPDFYYPPSGFCFDIECGDEVLNDDVNSPDYNVPRRVNDFLGIIKQYSQYYQTNNILIPMGGDFQYQSAAKNFVNLDKLITGFKDQDDINIIYSTPSCYIQAVYDEATTKYVQFTVKTDDFFPYASGEHTYWTGYFTTRPNAKRFERTSSNILQAGKQLASFSRRLGTEHQDDLTLLKQAIGILQHHDAITGTAKQAVANDYARLLNKGIKTLEPSLSSMITNILQTDATATDLNLELCLLANVTVCSGTDNDKFLVAVYNPLEREISSYVRLPVLDGSYVVTGPDGEVVNAVVDSISSFDYLTKFELSPKPFELVFRAENIPGFGLEVFYVERDATVTKKIQAEPKVKFGTETTGFEIDDDTGRLKSVTMNGVTLEVTQEFLYYNGWSINQQASGAYIFRPIETEAVAFDDKITVTSTSNDLVDEVHQQINDWITQIIRVYKNDDNNYIEFDWLVGPIDIDLPNNVGKEIITRFTVPDFLNEYSFYTDANGRELIKRRLNERNDYSYDATSEPVTSNYYPVTSKILIRDEVKNLEVAVLNDRAQGGASLDNGQIELMIHRALLVDDEKGVGEAINDVEYGQGVIARGQHYLVIGSTKKVNGEKSIAAKERELALKKLLQPVVLVADATSQDLSLENFQSTFNQKFSGVAAALPDNVHILSFEPWKNGLYLLRLEHILEKNEDEDLSQTVTVDLSEIFGLDIKSVRETTLGANQWLNEFNAREKYIWQSKTGDNIENTKVTPVSSDDFLVTLDPMQIRTILIEFAE